MEVKYLFAHVTLLQAPLTPRVMRTATCWSPSMASAATRTTRSSTCRSCLRRHHLASCHTQVRALCGTYSMRATTPTCKHCCCGRNGRA